MMRRRRLCFAGILLMLIIGSPGNRMCVRAEDTSKSKNVIVLLDTSGSMARNDEERKAIDWAKGICALGMDLDIKFSVITFQSKRTEGDAIRTIFTNEIMDIEKIKEVNELLASIEYNGTLTDHLDALATAVTELNEDSLKETTIVILSDSNLDYVNRGEGEEKPLTEEEKGAIKDFQNMCRNLASRGSDIILVGFGEDVSMFQELDGNYGIRYLPKDYTIPDITREVYQGNGYIIEDKEVNSSDGEIPFEIEKNYYRSIINFGKAVKKPVTKDEIQVYHNGQEGTADFDIVDMESSVLLYLKETRPGRYHIKISNCLDSSYVLWHLAKNVKAEMEIAVYDKEGREISRGSGGYYEVNEEDDDNIWPLKLSVQIPESISAEEIEEFYYKEERDGAEPAKHVLFAGEKAGEWNSIIERPKDCGKYSFQIYMKIDGIEDTKWVMVNYIEPSMPIQEEEVFTGVGKINELRETNANDNTQHGFWLVKIDGHIYEPGEENKNFKLKKDGTLIFKEKGDYEAEVWENGKLVRHIKYEVSGEEVFEDERIILLGVGSGVIVVVLIGRTAACRRKRERF